MKKYLLVFLLLLISCRGITPPPDFVYTPLPVSAFTLASWSRLSAPAQPVKIYIEGDGHAFNIDGRPTRNPTPRSTFLREIAFGDPHPNVVYLARPCQFVSDPACSRRYWTTARFAPEVITAAAEAVSQISAGRPVTLVGFSGGAMVAALTAVLHPELNIQKVVTISGNLDHQSWTAYHQLPPLTDSLNLPDYMPVFQTFPQFHYLGEDDDVIPPALIQQLINNPRLIRVVPGAGHANGYESVYSEIRAQ